MNPNVKLIEKLAVVETFAPAVPSSSTTTWISLKNLHRVTFLVKTLNNGTPTPGTVGLSQAKTVAGGSAKTLAFDKAARVLDTAATDVFEEFDVTSNSFTSDATASKANLYAIDVRPEDLDINNGFDCVRVTLGNTTGVTVSVIAVGLRKDGGLPNKTVLTD